jgi:TM2 domain-containing membrane protein YozV
VNYYVADGSTQKGPFTIEELKGQGVRPETLVWKEGAPNWLPAGQVPELISAGVVAAGGMPAGGAYPPPPPVGVAPYATPAPGGMVPPYNPANSNRVAAGVCGILLGAFGVHKFILGMNTAGAIMLAVTLVTCGFGGIIMHAIGIIEGIIYLTKTDEEFYNLYVVQKKEWF